MARVSKSACLDALSTMFKELNDLGKRVEGLDADDINYSEEITRSTVLLGIQTARIEAVKAMISCDD